ncbi:MAG: hypothetical protein J6U93_06245 [Alistipes sp.]|nr:hypothetical protein [Alistipes sp.]
MAKITVELEAFYGYSCGFQSHSSNETVELEISDNELDALKKLGKEQITAEDIVAAIESGDTTLQSLHEKLEEKFYYMVEEYWLYEADNECLDECLAEHIEQDMSEGIYPPVTYDELIEWYETGDIDSDKLDFLAGFDEGGYLYEDQIEEKYDEFIRERYYDWVKEHDHEFVAERVGLDLDACRDDEVDYTISLPND